MGGGLYAQPPYPPPPPYSTRQRRRRRPESRQRARAGPQSDPGQAQKPYYHVGPMYMGRSEGSPLRWQQSPTRGRHDRWASSQSPGTPLTQRNEECHKATCVQYMYVLVSGLIRPKTVIFVTFFLGGALSRPTHPINTSLIYLPLPLHSPTTQHHPRKVAHCDIWQTPAGLLFFPSPGCALC